MAKKSSITLLCSVFALLLNPSSSLQASQVEELLAEYEESADLSKRTRIESLGNYLIISRKELDQMQAYTLSDVLRSLKLHTYLPNRFGIYQLTPAGSPPAISTSYRLYIDDHEVSSIHTDNPFLMFDTYPLDGINHIEIYYGAGAVRLGNEPSIIIIKLYTKDPLRENASLLRASMSSRKDYSVSFNIAKSIKPEISYNIVVNRSYFNFPSYKLYGREIGRDIKGSYLFFKLNYYDTTVDLSYIDIHRDAFGGLAVNFLPEISRTWSDDIYINLTQNFLQDKSLKLNVSFDTNNREGEFSNDISGGGVFAAWFYPYPPVLTKIPVYYYEKRKLNKYTFYLSKEFKTEKNTLLIGASYKIKENKVDIIKYRTLSENIETSHILPLSRIDLTTLFLENQFNLSEKHLLFASLKYDYYRRNGGYKDISEFIGRIGFTSFLSENLFIKGFLTRSYIPPSFFEIEMSAGGKDLKPEKLKGATLEVGYKKDNQTVNLFYGYAEAKDMIIFNPYAQNLSKLLTGHFVSIDYEYKLNLNSKIYLNLYKTFNNYEDFSSTDGGALKIFNSTDKFDLYNELVYRKGFSVNGRKLDDSFNYNVAIRYHINRNTSLNLRGDNLLNSSPKAIFGMQNGVLVFPSFDRRFIISLEKVF